MKLLTALLFTWLFSLGPIAAADQLDGKISPEAACKNGKVQLFISEKKSQTLIYQVNVLATGSFSFRLAAGTYDLSAKSNQGCEANQEVVMSDLPKTVTLNLRSKK